MQLSSSKKEKKEKNDIIKKNNFENNNLLRTLKNNNNLNIKKVTKENKTSKNSKTIESTIKEKQDKTNNIKKANNFKATLKRFEEEQKAHKIKLENIRKQQIEKELSICTKAPQLNKKKNDKIKKDFLERQKEYSDIAKKNKDKIAEKVNQQKLKEEEALKKYNEKLNKKYQHKGKESLEQGIIQRLYKDDVDKRTYKKQLMSEMFKPVFIPNFIPEKNNRNNSNEQIFYEQVLYERIREKEEDISKNVEDTKQLFDDLDIKNNKINKR